ncbi:MAG: AAA family ATPase [Actinocatenispora sp.]
MSATARQTPDRAAPDRPRAVRFRHGMVLGKFYPPHAGHHHLIDTAARACERVTVICAPSTVESIPLVERLAWLREAHGHTPWVRVVGGYDDTPVDFDDPDIWAAHCATTRDLLARAAAEDGTGPDVDAVFSSEAYGPELARRFDAVHVPVDPQRGTVPVSGTAVRADPVAYWSMLGPAVRAWFVRRVVVLGAESTGTSTLAEALARHYRRRGGVWSRTRWVPEYGRTLTERKLAELRATRPAATMFDLRWDVADFVTAATEQNAAEDAAARLSSPLLCCDTDSFATAVWQERYLGSATAEVRALARTPDLYLLTDHVDVPFHDDGLRDGEYLRAWMTGRFAELLATRGCPTVRLTGGRERRLADAVRACDRLLRGGWDLAAPLG